VVTQSSVSLATAEGGGYLELDEKTIVESGNLFPDGRTYSLNSKRLTTNELSVIATMLEIPGGVSVTETRQLIEDRLGEIGHEPQNIQVVVQANDEALQPNKIFLVDKSDSMYPGVQTPAY